MPFSSKFRLIHLYSIDRADWLTVDTREAAKVKLSKFGVKAGFPDVWKDYSDFNPVSGDPLWKLKEKATAWHLRSEWYDKLNSVLDRNEWHMTPQTVNAYFSPTQNEIVFPAAILQPPFYHPHGKETIDFDLTEELAIVPKLEGVDVATAANFGAIGAVIAHEITHGYVNKACTSQ